MSEDYPQVHSNLPRIERSDADGTEGRAGAESGSEAGGGIVHHVGITQTADEIAAQFRVIQQVGGIRRNLHFDLLVHRETSPQAQIHIEAAGTAQIANGRIGVAYPEL